MILRATLCHLWVFTRDIVLQTSLQGFVLVLVGDGDGVWDPLHLQGSWQLYFTQWQAAPASGQFPVSFAEYCGEEMRSMMVNRAR